MPGEHVRHAVLQGSRLLKQQQTLRRSAVAEQTVPQRVLPQHTGMERATMHDSELIASSKEWSEPIRRAQTNW